MAKIKDPIVYQVPYSRNGLNILQKESKDPIIAKLLLQYPTVYIIHSDKKSANQVTVYVGETTDINRRTVQHLVDDPLRRTDWASLSNDQEAKMWIEVNI